MVGGENLGGEHDGGGEAQFFHPAMSTRWPPRDPITATRAASRAHSWTPVKEETLRPEGILVVPNGEERVPA